ncbi:hypothetical protein ACHQM5_030822 [Ranunculus cassubicifolius]
MASLSSFSSLSIHSSHPKFFNKSTPNTFSFTPHNFPSLTSIKANPQDSETTFYSYDDVNPDEEVIFDPPVPPEGYTPPPAFDEGPEETEDEIAAAYEELYGPAYSGVSVLGDDVYVMDAKVKKSYGFGSKTKKEKVRDGFDERVVQVRRVTKVVKGGNQLHFRAVVGKAKEVVSAVQKSVVNVRRNIITVPMTKYATFPHCSSIRNTQAISNPHTQYQYKRDASHNHTQPTICHTTNAK